MTGEVGEYLANVLLSRKTSQGFLFRTTLIAGKWPTIDLYAELISKTAPRMFCFFQVKTTEQGYTRQTNNLKIGVDLNDLIQLAQYCAPSYLVGIDLNPHEPFNSPAYIATIRGKQTKRLSSLPTTYPLSEQNLIRLKDEVAAFWNHLNPLDSKANYLTNFIV